MYPVRVMAHSVRPDVGLLSFLSFFFLFFGYFYLKTSTDIWELVIDLFCDLFLTLKRRHLCIVLTLKSIHYNILNTSFRHYLDIKIESFN